MAHYALRTGLRRHSREAGGGLLLFWLLRVACGGHGGAAAPACSSAADDDECAEERVGDVEAGREHSNGTGSFHGMCTVCDD